VKCVKFNTNFLTVYASSAVSPNKTINDLILSVRLLY